MASYSDRIVRKRTIARRTCGYNRCLKSIDLATFWIDRASGRLYYFSHIAKSGRIVYKSLFASFSAVVPIATLFWSIFLLPPSVANAKPRRPACVDKSPVNQRVLLTLKADKKVVKDKKVTFEPIVGKVAVKPGDIIQYTVIAKNNSHCPLKNLMLKQPIPRGTNYLKDSATGVDGAELLFSIDGGKTFVARPKIDNKEAPASAYDYIRWRFPKRIGTKSQVWTKYKLQVK
jgi:uncharacterized repeat protein (TIGR01451 family)